MARAPGFSIGWHPVDPGPGPRSHLLDQPPAGSTDVARAHHQWRASVEQHEDTLLQQHLKQPFWHPITLPAQTRVIPVYGGSPDTLDQISTTLVLSAIETGLPRATVVNLTPWSISRTFRSRIARAKRNQARFDVVSSQGSSIDLFSRLDRDEMIGLAVDALRPTSDRGAGRQSAREKQELLRVAAMLGQPFTLTRLTNALDVALGYAGGSATLSSAEERDLLDYNLTVVTKRRPISDMLSNLRSDLDGLRSFEAEPNHAARVARGGSANGSLVRRPPRLLDL